MSATLENNAPGLMTSVQDLGRYRQQALGMPVAGALDPAPLRLAHALESVAPGLMTSVQDLGRYGHQALGMPVAGAMDPVALRLANALVGNAENAAALEIGYLGPTVTVAADSVRVAFAGAAKLTLQ